MQTFPRVGVSTVDEIFGTQLQSTIPTKKQRTQTGFVDFTSRSAIASGIQTSPASGWFMAVEYDAEGNISNYYLTNLQK